MDTTMLPGDDGRQEPEILWRLVRRPPLVTASQTCAEVNAVFRHDPQQSSRAGGRAAPAPGVQRTPARPDRRGPARPRPPLPGRRRAPSRADRPGHARHAGGRRAGRTGGTAGLGPGGGAGRHHRRRQGGAHPGEPADQRRPAHSGRHAGLGARHAPGRRVLLVVEDAGPGVPESLRDAVFQPFRQGPSATPHAPGSGVGLALVAQFAALHGGCAWVEERRGGGASFRVSLPCEWSLGSQAPALHP